MSVGVKNGRKEKNDVKRGCLLNEVQRQTREKKCKNGEGRTLASNNARQKPTAHGRFYPTDRDRFRTSHGNLGTKTYRRWAYRIFKNEKKEKSIIEAKRWEEEQSSMPYQAVANVKTMKPSMVDDLPRIKELSQATIVVKRVMEHMLRKRHLKDIERE
ncbi:hypothetical protein M9H77_07958 [Catharanthus roseus]|uniref:Uncharacterized protein n=1 Tax=Catharanthus roseus TaxID=4058 RepID=A0ACC0BWT8_CATRO|nr:hypothetical protein M9H77_07958 [Catharanthus roseus]